MNKTVQDLFLADDLRAANNWPIADDMDAAETHEAVEAVRLVWLAFVERCQRDAEVGSEWTCSVCHRRWRRGPAEWELVAG